MAPRVTPCYLTPRQVRERRQISDRTLWRRLRDGTIPSVRVRQLVRIDERDLEAGTRLRHAEGQLAAAPADDARALAKWIADASKASDPPRPSTPGRLSARPR